MRFFMILNEPGCAHEEPRTICFQPLYEDMIAEGDHVARREGWVEPIMVKEKVRCV